MATKIRDEETRKLVEQAEDALKSSSFGAATAYAMTAIARSLALDLDHATTMLENINDAIRKAS